MKHKLLFNIIFFVSVAHVSFAMETKLALEPKKDKFLKHATSIQNPNYIKYITNNSVVIAGYGGCSIKNLVTKEEKKISDAKCSCLEIDQRREKIAFSNDNTVSVYSIEKGAIISTATEGCPVQGLSFGSDKSTLFACYGFEDHSTKGIIGYNYMNAYDPNHGIPIENYLKMVVQPGKDSLCVVEDHKKLLIYQASNLHLKRKVLPFDCDINDFVCGPDGYIALNVGSSEMVYLLDTNKENYGASEVKNYYMFDDERLTFPYLKHKLGYHFNKLLFYPRGAILAASLARFEITADYPEGEPKHYLSYWDLATRKVISIELLSDGYAFDFSFNPGGDTIAFLNKEGLFTMLVPFEVQYKNITKEKLLLYWLELAKLIAQQGQGFPQEIGLLLKHELLNIFKR